MDRRRILLIVAVIVALLGTALVFLYVRGADARANERFDTVNVLRAVAPIEAGESIDDAAANGKLALQPVAEDYLLPNYQTSVEAISGTRRDRPDPAGRADRARTSSARPSRPPAPRSRSPRG